MSLADHKRDWETLGELDAYWAVLTDLPRDQQRDKEAFFETGEREISRMLAQAGQLGFPAQRGAALDFGCGLGRLTRALAARFERCIGVDIAANMIEQARALNADCANCEFTLNANPDLGLFPDAQFDLVYSARVLQHVPGRALIKTYIGEFARVLKPGGLLVFQLPAHIRLRNRLQPRRRLFGLLRGLGFNQTLLHQRLRLAPMRMEFIPEADVVALLEQRGGRVLVVQPDDMCGPTIQSRTYYVTR